MKFTEGRKTSSSSYEWKTGHLTIEQILVIFSIMNILNRIIIAKYGVLWTL